MKHNITVPTELTLNKAFEESNIELESYTSHLHPPCIQVKNQTKQETHSYICTSYFT